MAGYLGLKFEVSLLLFLPWPHYPFGLTQSITIVQFLGAISQVVGKDTKVGTDP